MFRSLTLQNFRSYRNKSFKFSDSITVISGPNGSGKTNILEALYVLCAGKSFRGNDDNLLQYDAPWWRLSAVWADGERVAVYSPDKTSSKKTFNINGVKRQRLTTQFKLPVVLFEPDDLRLLRGSPVRRRTYLDTTISQLEPGYSTYLNRYERALQQRNNLLKHPKLNKDELFAWDVVLSENGARIIERRKAYIGALNDSLQVVYRRIAGTKDTLKIEYASHFADSTQPQQKLLASLNEASSKDVQTGFTSVGPHRDDVVFTMSGANMAISASRGETRSLVLALKLVELNQLEANADHPPLLLLDDVFSELDEKRRAGLLKATTHLQTVLTTTDAEVMKDIKGASEIRLK